jgi:Domain of unknown function (DUF4136)
MEREAGMSAGRSRLMLLLCLAALSSLSLAQKVKIGYDKSVDFSKYKTYTWAQPSMPVTRPLLYANVVGSIDGELHAKGMERTEKDGDLTLIAAGGIDFQTVATSGTPLSSTYTGPPPVWNATMWTGKEGRGELMGPVPDASLVLEFVDRRANQLIWSGTVTQKLDIEQKSKSLELVNKAIAKLLKPFPPSSSSK